MKQITNKTILKQGNKTYQPVEIDGVIYWVEKQVQDKGYVYTPNKTIEKIMCKYLNESSFMVGTNSQNSPFYIEFLLQIIAQSQPKLDGIPVISLNSYIENLADNHVKGQVIRNRGIEKDGWVATGFVYGYKSNTNQYTQKDIEKAIELARENQIGYDEGYPVIYNEYTFNEIIEQINSISVIEVDEQFNIINTTEQ